MNSFPSKLAVVLTALFGSITLAPVRRVSAQNAPPADATISSAHPKKIFAHFMGCWPVASGPMISNYEDQKNLRYDNRNPQMRVGGHIRNWPLVPPGTKLSLHDSCDLEIRRALRIGIDGFTVDAWAGSQSAKDTLDMMFKVAEEKNYPFELTITPDPNCLMGDTAVGAIKYLLSKHGDSPKLARRDGKPLIFGYQSIFVAMGTGGQVYKDRPELQGTWVWGKPFMRSTPAGFNYMGKAMQELQKQVGQPLYLEFCMSAFNYGIDGGNVTADQKLQAAGILAKYVGGVGSFEWLGMNQNQIAKAVVQNGAEWMYPIGFGQKENLPWESYGPPGLEWFRGGWMGVIADNSTLLQYITWNDYGENTALAPGFNTRYALYDLTAYYISWWKNGTPPTPDHDRVYIAYHKYPKGAKIFPFRSLFPRSQEPWIEVVTILPKPATIRLPGRNAEYEAPAGFYTKQFPTTPGPVVAELVRDDKTVLHLESPEPITDKPFREDNGYVCWSSEEERNWKLDFGDTPMWSYSEYSEPDHNGLPAWFEMYYFGKWLDFTSPHVVVDPNADPDEDGKTNLQEYQEQTDPTRAPTATEPTAPDPTAP